MKILKWIAGMFLSGTLMILTPTGRADGTNAVATAKPDLLKTCPVSDEKLGGDMGEPCKFVYQGQEVKLCCPMCKADFDKNPAKYIKKIKAAETAAKK